MIKNVESPQEIDLEVNVESLPKLVYYPQEIEFKVKNEKKMLSHPRMKIHITN